MKVNISKGFTYTPKWEGNNKLPEAERGTVDFEFVSGADLSVFFAAHDDKEVSYFIDDFCLYTKAVHNFKYTDESGEEQVLTPTGIASIPAFTGLYLELRGAYAKESTVKKKG